VINLLLEVKNLSKSFGGLRALSQVNIAIPKGAIVGLIGPNGSGKTTLFNLISGLFKPDSGKVIFNGHDITGLPPFKICRAGIARTFQLTKPFLHLSILENVMVGRAYGSEPVQSIEQIKAECETILEFVGLKTNYELKPVALIPVYKKRLEIARALATKPKLLLLDEMMVGLNPKEIEDAMELIGEIRNSGVTVVVVEHLMKAVLGISDRIIVLNAGEKIAEGAPEEIIENQQVIDAYLGDEKYAENY